MVESYSQVVLLGALRHPVALTETPSGAPCGQFELLLRKQTPTGSWYTTVVPCQLFGRHLTPASQLSAGQVCVFTGELVRRKGHDGYELCVSGWQLEPIAVPLPVPTTDTAMSRN